MNYSQCWTTERSLRVVKIASKHPLQCFCSLSEATASHNMRQRALCRCKLQRETMNLSVCLLFLTCHLLLNILCSFCSLWLWFCATIIIPEHTVFFNGVKSTWDDDITRSAFSFSLWHSSFFPLFPLLSLPPSILSQLQSLHHVSNACGGNNNDSHAEPSCSRSTSLCCTKGEPQIWWWGWAWGGGGRT